MQNLNDDSLQVRTHRANKGSIDQQLRKIEELRNLAKDKLDFALEQLNHAEVARRSMNQYHLHAQDNIRETVRTLSSLFGNFNLYVSELSREYESDITAMLESYKEEKLKHKNLLEEQAEKFNSIIMQQHEQINVQDVRRSDLFKHEINQQNEIIDQLAISTKRINQLESDLQQSESSKRKAEQIAEEEKSKRLIYEKKSKVAIERAKKVAMHSLSSMLNGKR